MIKNAEYNMVGALKKLWKEGFEDEEKYMDLFFTKRFKPKNTYVYIKNNSPVSIAVVLNASIYHNGIFLPAGYIYGVTTSQTCRGKGFSSEIIKHINSIYPVTFLVPATEELFYFYKELNFKPAFSLIEYELYIDDQDKPGKNFTSEIISPQEYKNIRDSHFTDDGYVCWDTEAIDYAFAENNLLGGSALKIQINDKKKSSGILLYRKNKDRLFILETTLPLPALEKTVSVLMKQHGVNSCCVRLPPDSNTITALNELTCLYAEPRPYGLLHSNTVIKNGYCNLTLD